MPKGVEHKQALLIPEPDAAVFLPLMPKGVEHQNAARQVVAVESCSFR